MDTTLYDRCHELFELLPDGTLINKTNRSPNSRAGSKAGWFDNGYWRVRVDKKPILLHRIVFLMVNGYLPDLVDHIDGNTLNNAPSNLRVATKQQNRWNSKGNKGTQSGVKGVYLDRGRWKALCNVGGQRYYLGMYSTLAEAEEVVNQFYKDMHHEYAIQQRQVM